MWTIIFFTSWQCSSFVMGNDDWLSHLSDESQPKCEKSPPKPSKNEKLIFILHLTSDDRPSDPSYKSTEMQKKSPKSSKNEMLVFGLHSNSDDQWSNESQPKCDKMPPKSSKNEMLIFGLHSASDDRPCNPRNKSWLKCGKRPPKSSKKEILTFILCSTSDDWLSNQMPPPPPQWKKFDFFKSTLLTWPKYASPLKILAEYEQFYTKPSEQGSFVWAGWNESKEWMLWSKLMKVYISQRNINSSAQNLQKRAYFSEPVKTSPRSGMPWWKFTKS